MTEMKQTTLWEAMAYVGTGDPDLLGHSIRFVEATYHPDYGGPAVVFDENQRTPTAPWEMIDDDVREHVHLHNRGGVHAVPGGLEYIETDEEFVYNGRIRHLAEPLKVPTPKAGFSSYVSEHIDPVRAEVEKALRSDDQGYIATSIDTLAIWNNVFWNQTPWHTRTSVLDGSADLGPIEGHQPRIIRQAEKE